MDFCSDCKWAKLEEEQSGIFIYCIKPVPKSSASPNRWIKKINVRKRLSATACGNFERKDDAK